MKIIQIIFKKYKYVKSKQRNYFQCKSQKLYFIMLQSNNAALQLMEMKNPRSLLFPSWLTRVITRASSSSSTVSPLSRTNTLLINPANYLPSTSHVYLFKTFTKRLIFLNEALGHLLFGPILLSGQKNPHDPQHGRRGVIRAAHSVGVSACVYSRRSERGSYVCAQALTRVG